jgi:hypothetical protein
VTAIFFPFVYLVVIGTYHSIVRTVVSLNDCTLPLEWMILPHGLTFLFGYVMDTIDIVPIFINTASVSHRFS